jgi:putative transposase
MRRIDEQYLRTPFYGSRKLAEVLAVNRKRVQRLMRLMGIAAIYPKRRTTWPAAGEKVYPYLLRNVAVTRPDQVWSSDITYVPLRQGFLYLVAVMDWYSRYVISWRLSNTLTGSFCLEALDEALSQGTPEIFNSDQGSQYTAAAFTSRLEARGVAISMDGRGRAIDNVFIERLWRSVKYEEVYLKDYASGWDAEDSLAAYFHFYSHERVHQALDYRTPAELYSARPRARESMALIETGAVRRKKRGPEGPPHERRDVKATPDTLEKRPAATFSLNKPKPHAEAGR